MVRVSTSKATTDKSPTTPNRSDRVDRGVVINSWVKGASMLTLRLLIIAVFLFALGRLIGAF